jgi:hypothetical protein
MPHAEWMGRGVDDAPLTTPQKALALNLDPVTYGAFAEIGGGQEVARWFFALHQKEALGILGVNLVHGAFYRRDKPTDLIKSLTDELSRVRVEIDMIKLFARPSTGSTTGS